jgi:hypothetical protein
VSVDRDGLYGLPLDRFVPERNALAKALRQDGLREEAAEVAALRKPSVAARAVNRLARECPDEVEALLAAGDDLIDVQSRLVQGEADGRELAEAAERERAALSELVARARTLLADEGQKAGPAILERVSETLHAAALDVDARPPVAEGRLERELRHVGFWTGAGGPTASAHTTKRPAASSKSSKASKAEAEEQARAARQREAARKDAQAAVTDARRAATRAEKALAGAQRRRAKAAEALQAAQDEDREAEEAVRAARREAEDAADSQAAAERELAALSDD